MNTEIWHEPSWKEYWENIDFDKEIEEAFQESLDEMLNCSDDEKEQKKKKEDQYCLRWKIMNEPTFNEITEYLDSLREHWKEFDMNVERIDNTKCGRLIKITSGKELCFLIRDKIKEIVRYQNTQIVLKKAALEKKQMMAAIRENEPSSGLPFGACLAVSGHPLLGLAYWMFK